MYKGAQHSHTVDGQLFNSARKFSNGLDSLNMTKPGLIHDAFGAFAKVVEYPFRTGVSKTIILLTCSGCGEYNSQYARVADLLSDNDITLHVLNDKGFQFSGNRSPRHHTIYGKFPLI